MKHTLLFLSLLIFLGGGSCKARIGGLYRYYCGRQGGYDVWIIDGSLVRKNIDEEFLYGGNEQRYPYVPKGEIWIDNAISCEEYDLTVAHELNERHLMAKFGWEYQTAHDSSLRIEQKIRRSNELASREHEASIPRVAVTDSYNVKEINSLPDSIRISGIYRIPEGDRNGISVWIVDGYMVRKNIYPDFGFSGNDFAYHFIPPGEIWIDGQVSCEETEYSIEVELAERNMMKSGMTYNDAYKAAIEASLQQRSEMVRFSARHPHIIIPDSLFRDRGVIDPNEK